MDQMKDELSPLQLRRANTFFARAFGLFLCRRLDLNQGLVIEPCSSIHTFFMRRSVDVFFFDREKRFLKRLPRVLPWRVVFCRCAFYAVEFPGGSLLKSETELVSFFQTTVFK
jgi:uncharacterized protein